MALIRIAYIFHTKFEGFSELQGSMATASSDNTKQNIDFVKLVHDALSWYPSTFGNNAVLRNQAQSILEQFSFIATFVAEGKTLLKLQNSSPRLPFPFMQILLARIVCTNRKPLTMEFQS